MIICAKYIVLGDGVTVLEHSVIRMNEVGKSHAGIHRTKAGRSAKFKSIFEKYFIIGSYRYSVKIARLSTDSNKT